MIALFVFVPIASLRCPRRNRSRSHYCLPAIDSGSLLDFLPVISMAPLYAKPEQRDKITPLNRSPWRDIYDNTSVCSNCNCRCESLNSNPRDLENSSTKRVSKTHCLSQMTSWYDGFFENIVKTNLGFPYPFCHSLMTSSLSSSTIDSSGTWVVIFVSDSGSRLKLSSAKMSALHMWRLRAPFS